MANNSCKVDRQDMGTDTGDQIRVTKSLNNGGPDPGVLDELIWRFWVVSKDAFLVLRTVFAILAKALARPPNNIGNDCEAWMGLDGACHEELVAAQIHVANHNFSHKV